MAEQPKFYTDVHIALEAIHQLQRRGVDIIHCGEVGLSNADDVDQLTYATENGRIMVSCDEDFERLHSEWQEVGRQHGGIVYFRMVDQCKSISIVVREILFLYEAADYQTDLYNQIWSVKT